MSFAIDKEGRRWVKLDCLVEDLDEFFLKESSDETDVGLGHLHSGTGRLGTIEVDVELNECWGLVNDM